MPLSIASRSPATVLALTSRLNFSAEAINMSINSRVAQKSARPAGLTICGNQAAESEAAKVNTLRKNTAVVSANGPAQRRPLAAQPPSPAGPKS